MTTTDTNAKKPTVGHIGIIVADIDEAVAQFGRLLGIAPSERTDLPHVGVRIAMIETANVTLELVQHTGEGGRGREITGSAVGINHISLNVDDLGDSIAAMEAAGANTKPGFPIQGAHGQVAFFEPESTSGLLLEICEPDRDHKA